jgi:dihydroorotate dehydrogenase electron transfer subunit
MVHLKDNLNTLLPRPFSSFRAEKNNLELIFKEVGKGTGILAVKDLPFSLKIWGPLGNSFPFNKDMLCVAGGLGLVPLYENILKGRFKKAFIGFKNIEEAYLLKNLIKKDVFISTDDGSFGEKGFITEFFNEYINKEDVKAIVVACGPIGLLKRLWQIEKEYKKIEIYGSFETYMGCGFGVCLGCTLETKRGMVKVCCDGPVFRLKEVFGE